MGTSSSICGSDTEVPDYSPAYLGQIYAGVILNSARSASTGYASTLSLNSLYASTLSLNSLCDRRRNSLAPNARTLGERRKEDIPLIDEGDEHESFDPNLLHPKKHPPIAEPESLSSSVASNNSLGSAVNIQIDEKNENKRVIEEENEKDLSKTDKETNNVLNLLKSLPFCGRVDIIE